MSGRSAERRFSPRQFGKTLESLPAYANYSLRSAFFVRKLREWSFLTVAGEVRKLLDVENSFNWRRQTTFGIDPDVFERITACSIDPVLYFLHPRVLSEQPALLLYYRCVAMISQKGLSTITGGSIAGIENGSVTELTAELRTTILITVNRLLCTVAREVLETQPLRRHHVLAFLYAQAGTQIQGSWNNAIGEQGELVVKKLLLQRLAAELVQIVWRDDTSASTEETSEAALMENAHQIKVLRLRHGFHCIFASEPDVSLRDAEDVPLVSVEVKAGSDPAGALERYGAAKKSFDHELGLNPRLKTVYVATCLTPEVQRRIREENPFSHTFLLIELMDRPQVQKRFANLFVREIVKAERRERR